jgi:hypothetical protein
MQRGEVPLRVIDGEVDPISGAHMVARYRELIPDPDTVLLTDIGHYPQIEAPCQVLKHYLAFRDRLVLPYRSKWPVPEGWGLRIIPQPYRLITIQPPPCSL